MGLKIPGEGQNRLQPELERAAVDGLIGAQFYGAYLAPFPRCDGKGGLGGIDRGLAGKNGGSAAELPVILPLRRDGRGQRQNLLSQTDGQTGRAGA